MLLGLASPLVFLAEPLSLDAHQLKRVEDTVASMREVPVAGGGVCQDREVLLGGLEQAEHLTLLRPVRVAPLRELATKPFGFDAALLENGLRLFVRAASARLTPAPHRGGAIRRLCGRMRLQRALHKVELAPIPSAREDSAGRFEVGLLEPHGLAVLLTRRAGAPQQQVGNPGVVVTILVARHRAQARRARLRVSACQVRTAEEDVDAGLASFKSEVSQDPGHVACVPCAGERALMVKELGEHARHGERGLDPAQLESAVAGSGKKLGWRRRRSLAISLRRGPNGYPAVSHLSEREHGRAAL
mmetsp:Transcript_13397/g.42714  ORF Transcript_13397/g.42714 Transcript_13397/m.42714 type:complete len:302 (-) Transcript_13397:3-908(-)